MKRAFTFIEFLVVFAIVGILAAVVLSSIHSSGGASTPTDTQSVADNQHKLSTAVPLPQLSNSLERANISKRLTTFDDPAKISYIYLTSYGKVMAFYTVKGKVTSGTKRLTNPQRAIDDCGGLINLDGGDGWGCTSSTVTVDSPELDGTYGSSGNYIYFWTTDGTYVQWSGEYMLADQPLQLTTQPELVRAVK